MMASTQENVHFTLNSGPGVMNKSNRVHARIQEFLSGGGWGWGDGVEAHVMSPQGIRRMMETRTNQPMQKYRCSYKAFKWNKHSQNRKLWVFLQYEGREMYYSDS